MTHRGRMRVFAAVVAAALITAGSAACSAEGDIVYGARYYLKPGSKGLSHFHIYRIDPDGGGRTQVTYGPFDDTQPEWSPDGRMILFIRGGQSVRLCATAARGGRVRTIYRRSDMLGFVQSPDGRKVAVEDYDEDYDNAVSVVDVRSERLLGSCSGWFPAWAPNSQMLYVCGEKEDHLLNLKTGHVVRMDLHSAAAVWLNGNTIAVSRLYGDLSETNKDILALVDLRGRLLRQVHVKIDRSFWNYADRLYRIPGEPGHILYAEAGGETTGGRLESFYDVDLAAGQARAISYGRDASFAPGAREFCTGSSRDLLQFDIKRLVWISSLSVVSMKTGKKRNIVSGRVYVDGCDWRRGRRPKE